MNVFPSLILLVFYILTTPNADLCTKFAHLTISTAIHIYYSIKRLKIHFCEKS